MPAIPIAMMGASAIGGALANRSQRQTTTPTMSPEYSPLQNLLLSQIQGRLNATSALPAGYETGQIRNINQTYDLAGQSLANRLTARGLGTSPVAGAAETSFDLARAGDITRMQSGIPLLERSLRDQDLAMALQTVGLGRGSTTTTSGNMAGGGLMNMASMMAYLYGQGAFGNAGAGGGSTFQGSSLSPALTAPYFPNMGFTGWAGQ